MEYAPQLLSLAAVDLLAAMTPGPNFVLVTESAIRRTSRHAAAVVLGFVITNVLWCCAVLFGLSAIFTAAPWLYRAIRIAGGAYLLWLGIGLWRSSGAPPPRAELDSQRSLGAAFARGLLTNLSNPKSVVYFGSIFALFMQPGTPVWVQTAAVAIVVTNTILWYGALAALFSRVAIQRLYARARRGIDRAAGMVMAAFGIRLIYDASTHNN